MNAYNGFLTGRDGALYPHRDSGPDDFPWAYDMFKRVNMDAVTALAGWWPEPHQTRYFNENFHAFPPQIIEDEGAPAGLFCLDESDPRIVKLRHLHIDTGYQGRGIGTAVLEKALDRALEIGRPLYLEALTSNARAIHLYRQFGFFIGGPVLEYSWVREFPMYHAKTVSPRFPRFDAPPLS